MKLIDILELETRGMISLVGGGGKTTTMYKLCEELKEKGYKVLLTTTTAIGDPRKDNYKSDYFFIEKIEEDFIPQASSITIFADRKEGYKLRGGNIDYLDKLFKEEIFDFIIIEADGAFMLPIKAPNNTEPVIPKSNTMTIGIVGIDSLNKKINEIVHRPELFLKIINKEDMNGIINKEDIVKLVLNNSGLFKNSIGRKIFFINKSDTLEKIEEGKKIRNILKEREFDGNIFITNIITDNYY